MNELKLTISPAGFMDDDSVFIFSREEWAKIQAFVEFGVSVANPDQAYKTYLGDKVPGAKYTLGELISKYLGLLNQLHTSCYNWISDTQPRILFLAGRIVTFDYVMEMNYALFKQLLKYLDLNPITIASIKTALTTLKGMADSYKDDVKTIVAQVQFFNDSTDQESIVCEELLNAIHFKMKQSGIQKEAYDIASGTYGVDALELFTKAKNHVSESSHLPVSVKDDLTDLINMFKMLTILFPDLITILGSVSNVLPVTEKLYGIWSAISSDIDQVLLSMDDYDDFMDIIDIILDDVVDQWENVAKEAADFLTFASINIEKT